ncbi:MAG: hypothetical protein KBS77_06905 [Bacteroidales bacterium]|nr:hypothetical protein [Candidatus Colicola faecequi]
MKRLFFSCLLLAAASFVMAQELSYTYVKKDPVAQSAGYILQQGNTYYCDGQALRGRAYANYLIGRNPQAYQQYMNGVRTANTGWGLLGAGVGLAAAGWWVAADLGSYAGIYMAYAGGMCLSASVPTLIVGYCRQHSSADTYNAQLARRQTAYWTVGTNGLALHF